MFLFSHSCVWFCSSILPLPSVSLSHFSLRECRDAMQAQDLLRQLRMPEISDVRQYVRGLPTNTLMGMGALAAVTTYWYATRPKALKPPCDLTMQSIEMAVRSQDKEETGGMTVYLTQHWGLSQQMSDDVLHGFIQIWVLNIEEKSILHVFI